MRLLRSVLRWYRRGQTVAHVRKSRRAVRQISCDKRIDKITTKNIASEGIPFGENMLRFVILIDTALDSCLALSFTVMELQTFSTTSSAPYIATL
jgi:hypothetical protein